ncbi:VOC family protein [Nocardia sp. CDC159]|uniref:VOC family protein n=1 Tax=Nocardia pulmonis TaxID=2951408 RepID=A0A9X2ECJ3_9NOCA|nr:MULTISPECIES: VOC family protein [Nocardia]MCM6778247.1 VOC family protein [Nocardia pulmonis]MCM6791136.1 VOC family protein [Nocardia sp. CDC159]
MTFMTPGQVVWFEIGIDAADPVQKFYSELLGWTYELDPDSSIDGRRYIRIIAPGAPFPMGAISEAPGAPARINLSILSTDVRADVDRLAKLGAAVEIPATQVADVTWFAVLTDPRGNPFSLFSRSESERFEERMRKGEKAIEEAKYQPTPGSMGWFELGTTDAATTQDFYTRAFGWKFVLDDGANATRYHIFTGDDRPSGGMYDQGPDGVDYLMPSFLVDDVPAATAIAAELGGGIELAPDAAPDGLVFSRIRDPRGLRFGLWSLPKAATSGPRRHSS